jgi:hypothetical protein
LKAEETARENPPAVTLAVDGEARVPIIVSEDAGPATLVAAEDLSRCLKIMTGAEFETDTVPAGRSPTSGIILGTLAEFPDADLNGALTVKPNRDGVEAFVIRTEPGRVRLIGATDLGASHAVYRLLEELGCGWLFPAPEWEVIPSRPSPTVALNLTDRPEILSRRIWWGYGFFDRRCRDDYETWARRNRMAQSRRIHCGHAWQTIIATNRKVFDEHPEYLAGIYYLGWQEAAQINGVHRSVFNVDVSRNGKKWVRKYRFESAKSFQYPTFCEHEGTIYLAVTQGDYSGSRKERFMFGRLESL